MSFTPWKTWRFLLSPLIWVGLFLGGREALWAQTPWTWSNSLPQGNSLTGVAYGNGIYVAAGAGGTTMVSADGVLWTVNPSIGAYGLTAIIYANGEFLTVGYNSGDTSIGASSTDGIHWTVKGGVSLPKALAYGAGKYISVGGSGSIEYSTDGVTWASATGGKNTYNSVAFGGGEYVAVGGLNGSGKISASSTGATWTSQTVGNGMFDSVAYGNGQFVAVATNGKIYVSADAANWTLETANVVSDYTIGAGLLQTFGRISFVNGQFLLPAGNAVMFSSSNGTQWTSHLLRTSSTLSATAYGNGRYASVGSSGAVFTSDDGCNWVERSASLGGQAIYAGAVGGGHYVVAGESGKISSSTDATNWGIRSSGTTKTLYGCAYGGSRFVVVGDAGVVRWSTDGTTWATGLSNTSSLLAGVTYGNGVFVAVGANGTALTSSDGTSWTGSSVGTTDALTGVAYGNGLFVTVSGKGEVFTSPDAITWTARNSGFANFLASVVFAQGRFVASGWAGTVITSTDGITWTTPTPATTQCLNSVIYNATNSHFIACGAAAGFVSSTDGLTWTQTSFYGGPALALIAEPTGQTVKTRANGFTINTGATLTGETAAVVAFTGLNLHAVGFGNSQFVAVGDNGAIFTSADGLSWSNEALVTTYSGSPPSLAGVIFAGGQWVAVGGVSADTILTSADGLTWVDHSKRTSNTLLSVSYGGGKYVAVGNSGKILYSTDGNTWTAATSGVSDNLLAVAYGNGVFVAVGGTSSIITSSDGITWQAKSFFAGQNVRFDNGLFVAINGTGITTSPDGVTWTARARPSNFVNATSFGNGIYLTVAATGDGVLTFVSRDTSTWYSVTSPCPMSVSGLRSIAFDGMQFVAVGDNGAILRATPSWPSLTQWRTVFYDTSANQGNAADTAAPINDHVPNLLKYAIGIDPRQNGAASLPTGQVLFDASTGANYLTMTINREGIAPGITYIVEVSADLTTWKSVPGTDVVYLSNTALLLEVRDNVPIPSSGSLSRFIRLRITDP